MRTRLALVLMLALTATAAAAKKGPYESNNTAKQAVKIRYGKLYKAGIESIASPSNTKKDDADWYRFKARRTGRVTVAFRNIGNKGVPCFGPVLQALDSKQKLIKYTQPANDKASRLKFKVKRGRSYFLLVTPHNVQQCDTPEKYAFEIAKKRS